MENTGFVVYNTYLEGYLNHDMHFTKKIASAKINTDEALCKTDIAIISSKYEDVSSYNTENMVIKQVSVTLIETT